MMSFRIMHQLCLSCSNPRQGNSSHSVLPFGFCDEIHDRSSSIVKGALFTYDGSCWLDLLLSDVLVSVVLVCDPFVSGSRLGMLSGYPLELELESDLPFRDIKLGRLPGMELVSHWIGARIDSASFSSGTFCLGSLTQVTENIRWSEIVRDISSAVAMVSSF